MRDVKNIVKFPDVAAVEAEAAEWVARFEGGACPAADRAKFQEWLNRSALHREAAARLFALWSDFDVLRDFVPAGETSPEPAPRRSPVFSWSRLQAVPRRAFAAAACASVLCAAVVFYALPSAAPSPVLVYQTAVGEQKKLQLPDGSRVLVNTNSRIEVTYTNRRRNVRLSYGEAYFDVAHDDARPFSVFSGDRVVRDIGTAFDVRLLQKAVEVTVTKGSVELTTRTGAGSSAREKTQRLGVVTAGQNALFDRKIEYIKPVSDVDMNRHLAWRRGSLVYEGEPLAQVVADVSRYTHIKIELGDPKLKDIPVGGYFAISRLDAVFDALDRNFGIRAQWRDATHVRLVAADSSDARRPPPP